MAGSARMGRGANGAARSRPAAAGRRLGRGGGGGAAIGDIQRMRLLLAAAQAVRDLGVGAVSVVDIVQRAGVSRKTFYELFGDREQCLSAAFEEALSRAAAEVLPAWRAQFGWRERVRGALAGLLAFIDREPTLGVLLLADWSGFAPRRRGEVLDLLTDAVDKGRDAGRAPKSVTRLTAEGVVGAVLTIVQTRLLADAGAPHTSNTKRGRSAADGVSSLLGELMAIVVLPYLGPAAAAKEQRLPPPAPNLEAADHVSPAEEPEPNPFKDLGIRVTYRTMRVLSAVGELSGQNGGGASNTRVARHAGVGDLGQISKLLARLSRAGLIENTTRASARGEAYAWVLTGRGVQVHRAITDSKGLPVAGSYQHGRTLKKEG